MDVIGSVDLRPLVYAYRFVLAHGNAPVRG